MSILVFFLFTLPILSGLLTALVKDGHNKTILLGQVTVSLAGSLVLFVNGEGDLSPPLSFMSEPVYFVIGLTPVLIYSCVLLVLAGLILLHTRQGEKPLSKFQSCIICFSLSFGFIAFISGQFMVRYIALDIVGLLAAATVFRTFSDKKGLRHFNFVFLFLRFGDLLLLAAILILNSHANTLDITAMIERATELPPGVKAWVFIGFLLAVMVKLGASPFDGWARRARAASHPISSWISGFLMPALGYYLLYRILPIREAEPLLQWATLGLGLLSLGLTVFSGLRKKVSVSTSLTNEIYSALLLCAVAFITPSKIAWLFVGLLFSRLFIALVPCETKASRLLRWGFPFLVNLVLIVINSSRIPVAILAGWSVLTLLAGFLDWWIHYGWSASQFANSVTAGDDLRGGDIVSSAAMMARWINQHIEKAILNAGFEKLKFAVLGLANWLSKNLEGQFDPLMAWLGDRLVQTAEVEKGFDRAIDWIGDKFMGLARGSLTEFEVRPAEQAAETVGKAMESLTEYEETNKRSFRQDLIWIPLFLIVVLFFMIVIARG